VTRKRGARRKSLVRTIPLTFGFTDAARRDAALQARTAVTALASGDGQPNDVAVLLRISLYCNSVLEQLTIDHSIESDGLADAIEAINRAAPAVIEIQERLASRSVCALLDGEHTALVGLVDAYEALLSTATRRESVEAMKRVERQAAAA
jgi:hypothetical protein